MATYTAKNLAKAIAAGRTLHITNEGKEYSYTSVSLGAYRNTESGARFSNNDLLDLFLVKQSSGDVIEVSVMGEAVVSVERLDKDHPLRTEWDYRYAVIRDYATVAYIGKDCDWGWYMVKDASTEWCGGYDTLRDMKTHVERLLPYALGEMVACKCSKFIPATETLCETCKGIAKLQTEKAELRQAQAKMKYRLGVLIGFMQSAADSKDREGWDDGVLELRGIMYAKFWSVDQAKDLMAIFYSSRCANEPLVLLALRQFVTIQFSDIKEVN